MITQKYQQGENEIKIEVAESIEDAQKNKFKDGEYTRYFVNGKSVSNYMTLVKYIVLESQKNNSAILKPENIEGLRKQMLKTQNDSIRKNLEDLKKQYGAMAVPDSVMKQLDGMIDKVNEYGIRVSK